MHPTAPVPDHDGGGAGTGGGRPQASLRAGRCRRRLTRTPAVRSLTLVRRSPADRRLVAEILVSSILIGGSSVLALVVRLVRTKAMAVLLGPAGFGLFAMFLRSWTSREAWPAWGSTAAGSARLPPPQRRTTGEWR